MLIFRSRHFKRTVLVIVLIAGMWYLYATKDPNTANKELRTDGALTLQDRMQEILAAREWLAQNSAKMEYSSPQSGSDPYPPNRLFNNPPPRTLYGDSQKSLWSRLPFTARSGDLDKFQRGGQDEASGMRGDGGGGWAGDGGKSSANGPVYSGQGMVSGQSGNGVRGGYKAWNTNAYENQLLNSPFSNGQVAYPKLIPQSSNFQRPYPNPNPVPNLNSISVPNQNLIPNSNFERNQIANPNLIANSNFERNQIANPSQSVNVPGLIQRMPNVIPNPNSNPHPNPNPNPYPIPNPALNPNSNPRTLEHGQNPSISNSVPNQNPIPKLDLNPRIPNPMGVRAADSPKVNERDKPDIVDTSVKSRHGEDLTSSNQHLPETNPTKDEQKPANSPDAKEDPNPLSNSSGHDIKKLSSNGHGIKTVNKLDDPIVPVNKAGMISVKNSSSDSPSQETQSQKKQAQPDVQTGHNELQPQPKQFQPPSNVFQPSNTLKPQRTNIDPSPIRLTQTRNFQETHQDIYQPNPNIPEEFSSIQLAAKPRMDDVLATQASSTESQSFLRKFLAKIFRSDEDPVKAQMFTEMGDGDLQSLGDSGGAGDQFLRDVERVGFDNEGGRMEAPFQQQNQQQQQQQQYNYQQREFVGNTVTFPNQGPFQQQQQQQQPQQQFGSSIKAGNVQRPQQNHQQQQPISNTNALRFPDHQPPYKRGPDSSPGQTTPAPIRPEPRLSGVQTPWDNALPPQPGGDQARVPQAVGQDWKAGNQVTSVPLKKEASSTGDPRYATMVTRDKTRWKEEVCPDMTGLRMTSLNTPLGNVDLYVEPGNNVTDNDVNMAFGSEWNLHGVGTLFDRCFQADGSVSLVDIGSGVGTVALTASRVAGQVYAIEPLPHLAYTLCNTVKQGGYQHVHVIHNALSDDRGKLFFRRGTKNDSNTYTVDTRNKSKIDPNSPSAFAIKLDDILRLYKITNAVVRIDVESFEGRTLAGANKFLNTVRIPCILMEWKHVHSLKEFGGNYVFDILSNHGFFPHDVNTLLPLKVFRMHEWPQEVLWAKLGSGPVKL